MAARAVLDTNILISGFLFGGVPGEILKLAKDERFVCISSLYILKEFKRVLEVKFHFEHDFVQELLDEIIKFSYLLPITDSDKNLTEDFSDNPIIETALFGKAIFLVTGDRRLKKARVKNLKIISAKEFITILGP